VAVSSSNAASGEAGFAEGTAGGLSVVDAKSVAMVMVVSRASVVAMVMGVGIASVVAMVMGVGSASAVLCFSSIGVAPVSAAERLVDGGSEERCVGPSSASKSSEKQVACEQAPAVATMTTAVECSSHFVSINSMPTQPSLAEQLAMHSSSLETSMMLKSPLLPAAVRQQP
jgi:hypothetical protein